ncbi:MAG: ABC transporter permease [Clostridiales bacterium]|nr:ABC transporter permease [Clostridiales bacterium]
MYRYILKRVLLLIPVLLSVIFVVFFIMSLTPTDAAEVILGNDGTPESLARLRQELGLDKPLLVQYVNYVRNLLKGDMGTSYRSGLSISEQIFDKLPNTMILACSAVLIAVLIGIPAGIISAKKQYTAFDNTVTFVALIGAAVPGFWMGLMGVLLFSVKLGWLPAARMGKTLPLLLKSLILPAFTVSTNTCAMITRQTRSSMLEVIKQDYIDTARSKGVKESVVTFRHMLSNALIPIITVIGLQIGVLLGGSVITENVFAWPGIGKYVVDSITNRDTPAVLGCVVVISVLFSLANLCVDLLYAFVDPRIKSQYSK